jgi:hypothetical protein
LATHIAFKGHNVEVLFKKNVATTIFSFILSHFIAALALEFCPLQYAVPGLAILFFSDVYNPC